MNDTEAYWGLINKGSCNGLMPLGNKRLPQPVLIQIGVVIWRLLATIKQFMFMLFSMWYEGTYCFIFFSPWRYGMDKLFTLHAVVGRFSHKWQVILSWGVFFAVNQKSCGTNSRVANDLRLHNAHVTPS